LFFLIGDSASSLVRLPFFLFPLIVHMPIYIMGRLGAHLVEHEEETQAQNKVVAGLLFLLMIYSSAFWLLWALFFYTPTGAVLAAVTVWMFAVYHTKMINDYYENAKRLMAAWRVLVGIWAPKRWDLSLTALSQYTIPTTPTPGDNPWVQRADTPSVPPSTDETPVKAARKRRPPTRRIIKHVLRSRAEAVKSLAAFFEQLEKGGEAKKVKATLHLARVYGWVDKVASTPVEGDMNGGTQTPKQPLGWRHAREVVTFLRKRGAKVASLEHSIEAEWAALSSDAESLHIDGSETSKDDDVVFVPSS
jgi:hypothetical protein